MKGTENKYVIVAVECGGTSFRLAICELGKSDGKATNDDDPTIVARTQIDSSHDNPQKTLLDCVEFLLSHKPEGGYDALGVATFGPAWENEFCCVAWTTVGN